MNELTMVPGRSRRVAGFKRQALVFAVVLVLLAGINLVRSPAHLWVVWPALGLAVALLARGLRVYDVFGETPERFERRA